MQASRIRIGKAEECFLTSSTPLTVTFSPSLVSSLRTRRVLPVTVYWYCGGDVAESVKSPAFTADEKYKNPSTSVGCRTQRRHDRGTTVATRLRAILYLEWDGHTRTGKHWPIVHGRVVDISSISMNPACNAIQGAGDARTRRRVRLRQTHVEGYAPRHTRVRRWTRARAVQLTHLAPQQGATAGLGTHAQLLLRALCDVAPRAIRSAMILV